IILFCLFSFISSSFLFLKITLSIMVIGVLFMVVRFFRVPTRFINRVQNGVLSPADGTIVAIEEKVEQEYFQDRRIQISIFMSVYNVHVNSYPIDGTVEYVEYHPGKYLIAKLPKASTDNEHNTIVVKKNERQTVLFRQIAGFVAKRIVCYSQKGLEVKQGEEVGMIKFGSRVDVFLPVDVQLAVNIGDKVRSKKTILAYF
ncbi:MAG: phosphatidylserine decarboxylase family protein, partial [Bacteroidales bacterium]